MTNSRRSFLGGFTCAVAGLSYSSRAAATPRQLRQLLAVLPKSEGYWSLVENQFPLRPGKIPMNAANLCPSPRIVAERVAEWTRDEDADVSFPNRASSAPSWRIRAGRWPPNWVSPPTRSRWSGTPAKPTT